MELLMKLTQIKEELTFDCTKVNEKIQLLTQKLVDQIEGLKRIRQQQDEQVAFLEKALEQPDVKIVEFDIKEIIGGDVPVVPTGRDVPDVPVIFEEAVEQLKTAVVNKDKDTTVKFPDCDIDEAQTGVFDAFFGPVLPKKPKKKVSIK
jgi:hypothetical protein